MRENINKIVSCSNFFNMRAFTYIRNQFFVAYTFFFYKKDFSKKMSLKNPKTQRKR